MSKRSSQGETPKPAGSTGRGDVDSNADTAIANGDATETAVEGPAAREPGPDSMIGAVLADRYKIGRKIGQGGMGAVYEAQHTLIGKRIAVKVLLDKYAEKDQVVARLEQEARLASSIGHANIIDITDFGRTHDGRTFVVMEYLEGESLGALISRQAPLDPERSMRICKQVASALGAAHEKGVIHRDIKPENIFLQQRAGEDFVKVVDFGISKSITADPDEVKLTQTGMVLGTPLYMSPEQARGDEELDHRIDIYALGVILYEMITGEVPFRGSNYLNILSQVISEEPIAPTKLVPGLDRDVEDVIMKAMAKEPDHRYPTMARFKDDLSVLVGDGDTRSTGARITAARWRRRKQRRSALQLLTWLVVLGVVAAGVIFSVGMMMDGGEKVAPAPPPPKPAPTPAAIPEPEPREEPTPETFELEIVTEPEGAMLYHESRRLGVSPQKIPVERRSGDMKLSAELEGYLPATTTLNPLVHPEGTAVVLKLAEEPKKPGRAGGRSRPRRDPRPEKAEEGKKPPRRDDTGDMMDNPFR